MLEHKGYKSPGIVLYSGKLLKKKSFCKLVENTIFVEKTFTDCLLVPPKDATPPDSVEKTFANSHRTLKFTTKVLSFKSFPLYYMLVVLCTDHKMLSFRHFRDSVETPLTLIQSGMNPIGTLHAFSVSSHPRTATHPNS